MRGTRWEIGPCWTTLSKLQVLTYFVLYIELTSTTTTTTTTTTITTTTTANMSGISAHVIKIYGEIGSHCLMKDCHVIINRFR